MKSKKSMLKKEDERTPNDQERFYSCGLVGLIRIKALQSLLSVSRPTIYRWINSGYFPKPSRIGGVSVWRLDVIKSWIDEKAPWLSVPKDT